MEFLKAFWQNIELVFKSVGWGIVYVFLPMIGMWGTILWPAAIFIRPMPSLISDHKYIVGVGLVIYYLVWFALLLTIIDKYDKKSSNWAY